MFEEVLAEVYALMRRTGRCFVSGTFVFEDPPPELVLELRQRSTHRLFGGRTHADFMKPEAHARVRLCGRSCAGGPAAATSPQREVHLRRPFLARCPDGEEAKRVALIYEFAVGRTNFLFVKLESFGAATAQHAARAFGRYVLRRQPLHGNARRENAYKDRLFNKGRALRAAAMDRRLWAWLPRQHWRQKADESALAYDERVRVGMEVFVPAALGAALVHKIRR